MTVSSVNGTSSGSSLASHSAQQLNDRFLKLLVAQMSNQDPLNPLDNAEVTSQMAQISTVTGINQLGDTVARLIEQFARVEAMQAAQLTGRDVLVAGDELVHAEGGGASGAGVELDADATAVRVEIRDANGAVVRTIDLGDLAAGIHRFEWDGRTDGGVEVAPGRYTFSVSGLVDGREVEFGELAQRRVEGVRSGGLGVELVLQGGGTAAYTDVRQIL